VLFSKNSKKRKQLEDRWDEDAEADANAESLEAYTDRLYKDLNVENPYKKQAKRKVWNPI